jgi:hypothetical protein
MQSMARLKGIVHGGRVVVQDRVDYPEGTELEIDVHEPADELDEAELAELDAAIEESHQEERAGKVRPADELIRELRASR